MKSYLKKKFIEYFVIRLKFGTNSIKKKVIQQGKKSPKSENGLKLKCGDREMSIDRDGLIDLNEMDFERNFKGLQ